MNLFETIGLFDNPIQDNRYSRNILGLFPEQYVVLNCEIIKSLFTSKDDPNPHAALPGAFFDGGHRRFWFHSSHRAHTPDNQAITIGLKE
jgi:hypothetical protein